MEAIFLLAVQHLNLSSDRLSQRVLKVDNFCELTGSDIDIISSIVCIGVDMYVLSCIGQTLVLGIIY